MKIKGEIRKSERGRGNRDSQSLMHASYERHNTEEGGVTGQISVCEI